LAQRPLALADGVATGPGVFDMKAGLVQAAHAIALLDDPSAVELLVTCDEEVGSATSRELVEARARAAGAVLVLEPSAPGGALKTARKGNGTFEVVIRGRAAHAGLEPERGVSALVEAAVQVLHLTELGRADLGTTVTPTVLRAGTADNVVPAEAVLRVDARIVELDERDRVEAAMRALHPHLEGAEVDVRGGITRPPMPAAMSTELFARACRAAEALDLPPLEGVAVGGASDGNFTAAIGIPTLDGLGAVGGGAHADDEHVLVPTLPARTALLSTLVTDLTRA
jgi:glutamate carboxypeptidase